MPGRLGLVRPPARWRRWNAAGLTSSSWTSGSGPSRGSIVAARDPAPAAGHRRHRHHRLRHLRDGGRGDEARRRGLPAEAVHPRPGARSRAAGRHRVPAQAEARRAPAAARRDRGGASFETNSPAFAAFLQTAERAAASDSVVLLRGESGTGQERLRPLGPGSRARAQTRPFVTVHCPMLSGDLMSSSLFGHRKGAFTGAVTDAVGKVEEAEGGTLFLDEVGDLTADAQARLLRFLNDRPTSGSASRKSARRTCGSWPRPTGRSRTRSRQVASARTSSSGSTSSP